MEAPLLSLEELNFLLLLNALVPAKVLGLTEEYIERVALVNYEAKLKDKLVHDDSPGDSEDAA